MKESKAMMRKEVSFMKKKGAPKSMIKHEMREMADKAGRAMKKRTPDTMGRAMVKKMAGGGGVFLPPEVNREPFSRPRSEVRGGVRMAKGGMAKSGGSFRHAADGIASKGKTKGKMVKMYGGGKC